MQGFTSGLSGVFGKKKSRPVFHIKLRRAALPNEVAATGDDEVQQNAPA
jgi:hypothetical protein